MTGTITQSATNSLLSTLNTTPATTQVGANANNTQMNQFLSLLTAQLKNQDPMSPTDPTQFIAQLAQFSTVEQLVQGNTKLDTISQGLSGMALGQYAGLINHSVTANATALTVSGSGSPGSLQFHVATPALTNIHVEVKNTSGTTVRSLPVSGTDGTIAFDGLDNLGNALPAGQYTVALTGTSTAVGTLGQSQSAGTLTSSGSVKSVQQGTGGTWQLQLADGRVVDASSVTSVQ
jgi:flagellar basal-body rod modification protein FlgD